MTFFARRDDEGRVFLPSLRRGRRHRRGSPKPPAGHIEELFDCSRPIPQSRMQAARLPPYHESADLGGCGCGDGGGCGSCEASCGGSWGDSGSYSAGNFNADAFGGDPSAGAAFDAAFAHAGGGDWGSFGATNYSGFNVQDPNNIDPNFGMNAYTGQGQAGVSTGGGDWGSAGSYFAGQGGTGQGAGYNQGGGGFGGFYGSSNTDSGGFYGSSNGGFYGSPNTDSGGRSGGSFSAPSGTTSGGSRGGSFESRGTTPGDPTGNIGARSVSEDRGPEAEPEGTPSISAPEATPESDDPNAGMPESSSYGATKGDQPQGDQPSASQTTSAAARGDDPNAGMPESSSYGASRGNQQDGSAFGPGTVPGGLSTHPDETSGSLSGWSPSQSQQQSQPVAMDPFGFGFDAPQSQQNAPVSLPEVNVTPDSQPNFETDYGSNYGGGPAYQGPGFFQSVGDRISDAASAARSFVTDPWSYFPSQQTVDPSVLTQSNAWINPERADPAYQNAPSLWNANTWMRPNDVTPYVQTLLDFVNPNNTSLNPNDYGRQQSINEYITETSPPPQVQTDIPEQQSGPGLFTTDPTGFVDFGDSGPAQYSGAQQVDESGFVSPSGAPEYDNGTLPSDMFPGAAVMPVDRSDLPLANPYADILDTGGIAYPTDPNANAFSPGANPQDAPGYYANAATAAAGAAQQSGAPSEAAAAAANAAAAAAARGADPADQANAAAAAAQQAGASKEQAQAIAGAVYDAAAAGAAGRGMTPTGGVPYTTLYGGPVYTMPGGQGPYVTPGGVVYGMPPTGTPGQTEPPAAQQTTPTAPTSLVDPAFTGPGQTSFVGAPPAQNAPPTTQPGQAQISQQQDQPQSATAPATPPISLLDPAFTGPGHTTYTGAPPDPAFTGTGQTSFVGAGAAPPIAPADEQTGPSGTPLPQSRPSEAGPFGQGPVPPGIDFPQLDGPTLPNGRPNPYYQDKGVQWSQGKPGRDYRTAEQAGITLNLDPGMNNTKDLDARFVERFNRLLAAMPPELRSQVELTSAYRPARRAEARELGMSEYFSQESVWSRSQGSQNFKAGRPDASKHGPGNAIDVGDRDASRPGHVTHGPALTWLRANAPRFGLIAPFQRDDPWHIQLAPGPDPSAPPRPPADIPNVPGRAPAVPLPRARPREEDVAPPRPPAPPAPPAEVPGALPPAANPLPPPDRPLADIPTVPARVAARTTQAGIQFARFLADQMQQSGNTPKTREEGQKALNALAQELANAGYSPSVAQQVIHGVATQAAEKAGYGVNSVYNILGNVTTAINEMSAAAMQGYRAGARPETQGPPAPGQQRSEAPGLLDQLGSFASMFNPISSAEARGARGQAQADPRVQPGGVPQADRGTVQARLSEARSAVISDLQANPNLMSLFGTIAQGEVGSQGKAAVLGFMETAMNKVAADATAQGRAATGRDLANYLLNTSYFPETWGKIERGEITSQADVADLLAEVARGSNTVGGATGNASGKVGFGGNPTTAIIGKEKFGIENYASHNAWAKSLYSAASGAPGFDVSGFLPGELGTAIGAMPPAVEPRAEGGPVEKDKPYLVGEEGPEYFVPDEPGTVLPYMPRGDRSGKEIWGKWPRVLVPVPGYDRSGSIGLGGAINNATRAAQDPANSLIDLLDTAALRINPRNWNRMLADPRYQAMGRARIEDRRNDPYY